MGEPGPGWGSLAATVSVAPPAGVTDTSSANDSDTESDTIARQADLRIVKTNNLNGLIPGQSVPYTLTVYNGGPSDVSAATVADSFDAGRVTSVAWSCAPSRELSGVGQLVDGTDGVDGLDGATAVVVSPDGKHAYVAGSADDTVALFTRDAATGILSFGTVYRDGTGASAIQGAAAVAMSPDGGQVYVAGFGENALEVFTRNTTTGTLASLDVERSTDANLAALTGPRGIAVAPDGRHVYVAAATGNAVVAFTRNLTTGALTWASTVVDGGGVNGLAGARAVVVSPDGRHVVAAGESDNGVAVFSRDVTTGALTFVEAKIDNGTSNDGLAGASALAFSPRGDALYVVGFADNAVVAFSRNATSGALTYLEAERDGAGTPLADGLAGPRGVRVSPDGLLVLVAGTTDGAIAVFGRNGNSTIDFLSTAALSSVVDLAWTPAGEQVYAVAATLDALAMFSETRGVACPVPGGSVLAFSQAADLPAQGFATYTATAVVSNSASGTLVNTATVAVPSGVTDSDLANNSSTDSDQIGQEADLAVTKTVSPASAVPGETVVYTLTVSNAGPALVSGVSVTDASLSGASYSSVSWSCASQGEAVCGLPASGSGNISHAGNVDLPAGGSVVYTITAAIATNATGAACTAPLTGSCLSNTGSATMPATYIDPSPGDHSATVEVPISPRAELSITKTVTTPAAQIAAGQPLAFRVQVQNCGPSNVTGAVVQDIFPADYAGATWTCTATNGSCPVPANGAGNLSASVNLAGGNPATCTGGGQATFDITGTVVDPPSSGVLSNVARLLVPSGVFDPVTGNNTASVQVGLRASADLAIIKTDGTTDAVPGRPITYSITVFNNGPDDAQLLQVQDAFPAELSNVSWTCDSKAPALGTLTFLEQQRQDAVTTLGLLKGLAGTRAVVVSPDGDGPGPDIGGRFVYATGYTEGALTTFSRAAADGALTYLGKLLDNTSQGVLLIDGLAGASGLAISSDGANLYVAGEVDDKVAVFIRNPQSGAPAFIAAVAQGEVHAAGTVDGLDGARDLALSPDGAHLYVTSPTQDAVAVFQREATLSGRLDWLQVVKDTDAGVDGLDGASGVRVSPDGRHVYVAGALDGAVAVFTRNADSLSADFGELTFLQVVKDGSGGVNFLAGAEGVTLSDDGAFAYVAASVDDAVSVFARNTTVGDLLNFGKLTYLSERHEGEASGLGGAATGLDGAVRALVASPDGQHLYVASRVSDAVAVFQRNSATGSLKFVEVRRDGTSAPCVQPATCVIPSLDGARALAVDPSGASLYVAAEVDSALTVFKRAGAPPTFAFTGGRPGANPPAPVVNGIDVVAGLKGVTDVATAGDHLVAVSFGDATERGAIVAFARDSATGNLVYRSRLTDGTGGVTGLDGASALAVYGSHIYVASQSLVAGDNTVTVFGLDPVSGALSFVEVHRQGQLGVSGIFGATDVAVSSDGSHVYIAGRTPGSLAVFTRNAIDGRLTFKESKIAGAGGIVGLQGAHGVTLSSDDAHVYVAASVDDTVAVFRRNTNGGDAANFGRVTQIQVVGGLPRLDRAMGIAASNDPTDTHGSRHLYVTGHTAGGLTVFARNVAADSVDFGKLTQVQGFSDGVGVVDGLAGARSVVVSPDGKQVYVAGENDDAVAVFAREVTGGTLVFVEARFDGQDGVDGLDQAYALAVSPNSRRTYVAGFGDNAIAVFSRSSGSRCTGAGVGSLLDQNVEIAAGGQVVYTVEATIDPGATGVLVNEARVIIPSSITDPGPDSNGLHPPGICAGNTAPGYPAIPDNNGCRDIDVLTPQGDLAVDKSDGDDVAVPGSEVTYTIRVVNDGPSNVVGATVHDDLSTLFPDGATWTCVAAPSGTLSFLGFYQDDAVLPGPVTIDGLQGARSVAVSPDGRHVYAASLGEDAVTAFALDGASGALTFLAAHFDGAGGIDGLDGAAAVLVSPDGKSVYVAGQVDDAVAVFDRDDLDTSPTFGQLTFREVHKSPLVAGLDQPVALAIDATGTSLYVAAANSSAITLFARNLTTGSLTFVETQQDGVGSVDGLAGASSVAVSFDGRHLYATGENDNAIVVFDRNPATGALTFSQSKSDGVGGVDGLAVPKSVVVSPDDLNVYVAGAGDSAIAVFSRDALLGTLTFRQTVKDGVAGADGLAGVSALAVSRDGGLGFHVYAAGSGESALAIYRRDAADAGRLTFVDAERDGFGPVDGLAGVSGVALAPDGRTVVAAGPVDHALAVFRRPTDSSCSGGSDLVGPDIVLDDVVSIAAHSEIVYRVTGRVDAEVCQVYPCTVPLVNVATVTSPATSTDPNPSNDSDTDTDVLSPRADLEITKTDHVSVLQGLTGASAVAVSPGGTSVYATGLIGDGVVAFQRTPATGALTFVEAELDNLAGVDGLNGAAAVLVSGDGRQVYVAGSADNAVVAFTRDPVTSSLTSLQVVRNGFAGVTGLLSPDALALSSDGRHLYAAAAGSSSIAVFLRDSEPTSATFGRLTFVGEVRDGVGGTDGLSLARALALSPDGGHLYAAGESDNAVAVFSRNASTGVLTFVEFHRDGVAGVAGLSGARGVALSPDGAELYGVGGTGNAVAHFHRDTNPASPTYGRLTFVSAYVDGVGGVDGLQGAAAVLVSPDPVGSDPGGQHLYVAGKGENAVAVFARDGITGALTYVGAVRQGQAGVAGLGAPVAVAASPDAEHVYAAGSADGAVVTFDRDWNGGTLSGTGALSFVEMDRNGDGTLAPGMTVSYDIVVTNHGPSGVRGALVTDIFPGELENVAWECFSLAGGATCLGGSSGNGDFAAKPVRLPAGGRLLITASGTVKPGATGTIINTATVAAPSGFIELAPANNTATDADTILARRSDLSVEKIACSDPLDCAATEITDALEPGTPIHYQVRVDNAGPSDALGASVRDVLPETLANAVWSCLATPLPGLLSSPLPRPAPLPPLAAVRDGDDIEDISRACAPPLASVDGLDGASAVAVSPDGLSVYVTGAADHAVALFRRDLRNGIVSFANLVRDGDPLYGSGCAVNGAVDGLRGASGVAVSADGLHVYVSGELDDSVVAFERQAVTGELRFLQFLRDNVSGVNGLGNVRGVAVSPDGKHLYTAAASDNGVGIFDRDAVAGTLTYRGIRVDGTAQPPLVLDGLAGAAAVAVSPDGAHVYVAGETDGGVAVFRRDAATGLLTFIEVEKDGQGGADHLAGARALAVSDDGRHVVVAAAVDAAVVVFERDAATGALTWVAEALDGVAGAEGLGGASGVAVSPDGESVYVSGAGDSAIAVFARDAASGALSPRQPAINLVDGVEGLAGVRALVVSPDGEQVYAAGPGDDALALLRRGRGSRCTVEGHGSLDDSIDVVAGGSVVYTLTADLSAAAAGELVNTATVTAPSDVVDAIPANDTAVHTIQLRPHVNLVVDKDDGQSQAVPGLPLTYTITVSNAGPSDLVGATLVDALPAAFTGSTWSCSATDALEFRAAAFDGIGGVAGLRAPRGVAIAPDPDGPFGPAVGAEHVYVASRTSNAIDLFLRDGGTGLLTFEESFVDGEDGFDGFGGATGLAISPDGRHLYATGASDDAVAVLGRDATTGALSPVEVERESDPAIDGLDGASAVAVSPDGRHVFVAGTDDDAVAVFARDAATGALDYLSRVKDGFGGLALGTLDDPAALLVTPDGAQVLVAGSTSDTLAVFDLDSATGALTLAQVLRDGVAGVDGLDLVQDLVLSPAGQFVYAAGLADDAIAIFGRDTATGALSFLAQVRNGQGGVSGLDGVRGLVMAPDGLMLYATSFNDDAVVVFRRHGVTGMLVPLQVVRNDVGGADGLDGARALAISPDGRDVYAVGEHDNAVAMLSRVGKGRCSASGSGSLADGIDLAVGASVTFTVNGTVASSATGLLENTATVELPPGAINSGAESDTDIDELTPVANLSVSKSDGVTQAVPGTPTIYVITVANPGPSDAPATAVTDLLTPQMAGASWTCLGQGGGVCAPSGLGGLGGESVHLPAGSSVVFALAVAIDPSATGMLLNTVSVAPAAGVTDPQSADNQATDEDLLVPSADLSLIKSVERASVEVGRPLRFTLTVTNGGPSTATGLSVVDLLPAGTGLTGAAGAGWVCTPSPSSVTCTGGSLLPGASTAIVVEATAPATVGNYVNGAVVSAATTDPNASNDMGTVGFTVRPQVPPWVTEVGTFEDTGDGELLQMETALVEVSRLDVTLTEQLFDPPGDVEPHDVTNPASYLLLEAGPDGVFGASTCGSVVGDDRPIALDSVAWDGGALVASIHLQGGEPLTDGLYRLVVCSVGGLRDLDDNPLDGNRDGIPGDDFIRFFRARIENLLDRPHFDFDTDLEAWMQVGGGTSDTFWDSIDADGFGRSGSLGLRNLSTATTLEVLQCIPVPSGGSYQLSGETLIVASPASTVAVSGLAEYVEGPCLTPNTILSTYQTSAVVGDTAGVWRLFSGSVPGPPSAATSLRVTFHATTTAGDSFDVRLDNLTLRPGTLSDGFETGDTILWSAVFP